MLVVAGTLVDEVDVVLVVVVVETTVVTPIACVGVSAEPHAVESARTATNSTNRDLRPCPLDMRSWRIEPMEQLMPHRWKLTFETKEDENHCDMVVHLDAGDRSLSGHGQSRRNPSDPLVPQVGEELAAARALHDLANHLTEDAWETIETFSSGD